MNTERNTSGLFSCAVLAAALLLLSGCGQRPHSWDKEVQPANPAAEFAFRNAVTEPSAGWTGPVFALSSDYPVANPGDCPKEVCTWLGVDVDFAVKLDAAPPNWGEPVWDEYMGKVLDYVKEGQDDQLADDIGFRTTIQTNANGAEDRWYHVPWMAYDETVGREFIHGTTNERTAHVSDLIAPTQTASLQSTTGVYKLLSDECDAKYPNGFETWAVGMYNPWGGWALGQAWPESGAPQIGEYLGSPMPAGLPFPEGTVVAKLLFTTAPSAESAGDDCFAFLNGSPAWTVDRHTVDPVSQEFMACEREPQTVRLIQMDIAVVDLRSPTRWVYGTFAYDGNVQDAQTMWDKLVPVGIQWGSDPWTFPAVPQAESIPARQSVLNDTDLYEHNGCYGRLAGPVDNEKSSCISCHASSFAASDGAPSIMGVNAPATFGFAGICDNYAQDNVNYFQNMVAPQAYHGGQFPDTLNLDTSLQMWVAFTQYGFYNTDGKPNNQCPDLE